MASLFKRDGWYYLQFYSAKRSPKRKQVALKTRSKRAATKLQSRLQDTYRLGGYDPWKDDRPEESADLSRLEDAIESFMAAKSHLSEKYVEMFGSLLRQFKEFRSPHYSTASLSTKDIRDFLDTTNAGAVSRHTYVRHLRVFTRWLIKNGALDADITQAVGLKKVPTKFPKYLMPDDIEAIVDAIHDEPQDNPYVKPEDVKWLEPLIRCAAYLGLQRAEICNVRWQDVDLEKKQLTVANYDGFNTKTGYDRVIPDPDAALTILLDLYHK